MKILSLSKWLAVGAAMSAFVSCHSNSQQKNVVPAPRAPESPSEDKVPCREEECDEEEAGEEAMIHVIEIDAPVEVRAAPAQESPPAAEEPKQAAVIEAPAAEEPVQAAVAETPAEPVQTAVEETPSEGSGNAAVQEASSSQESVQSTPGAVEIPSIMEEPTTKALDEPVPEKAVVLSVI